MSTIDTLRQQLENRYLEPVTEETPNTPLHTSIDDSQDTFRLTAGVLSPEDENYIAPGRILELDYELTRVISYDASTTTVTARRGVRGTEAAAHTATTTDVRFPTRWPRNDQKISLENAVRALWQPLFAIHEAQATVSSAAYVQLPLSTVRILSVEYRDRSSGEWEPISHKLLAKHPTDANFAAVQVGELPYNTLCVINYGTRIEVPATVTEEIEDMPEQWDRIVLADVAADLLSGVDIDAATQEYLTQQMRLEGFPVRSGASVSQNLIRYREYLMEQAQKDIEAAYPRDVQRKKVSLFS